MGGAGKIRRHIGKFSGELKGGKRGKLISYSCLNKSFRLVQRKQAQVYIGPVFNGKPMRLIEATRGKVVDIIPFT